MITLSASSLKEFSKCGEKYRLKKIEGLTEPGPKNYGMLNGRILGDAVADCCLYLNAKKSITDKVIAEILFARYQQHYNAAGVPSEILDSIHSLLIDGIDAATMNAIDAQSISLNCGDWVFRAPPPLKKPDKRGYSVDKKRLGMIILDGYENLLWFFDSKDDIYHKIKDAELVTAEEKFLVPLSDEVQVGGLFDLKLSTGGETTDIIEFKTDKTEYTQGFVDKMVQGITYYLGSGGATVHLVDITHRHKISTNYTDDMVKLTKNRYIMMAEAIKNNIFLPTCGSDPHTEKSTLCGFKCGGCAYAGLAAGTSDDFQND